MCCSSPALPRWGGGLRGAVDHLARFSESDLPLKRQPLSRDDFRRVPSRKQMLDGDQPTNSGLGSDPSPCFREFPSACMTARGRRAGLDFGPAASPSNARPATSPHASPLRVTFRGTAKPTVRSRRALTLSPASSAVLTAARYKDVPPRCPAARRGGKAVGRGPRYQPRSAAPILQTFGTRISGTEIAFSTSMMIVDLSLFSMISGAVLAVAASRLPAYQASLERLAGVRSKHI